MKRIFFVFVSGLMLLSLCVAQSLEGVRQEGIASWYGTEFAGRPTASGELFDPAQYTAAHPTLPFGTILRVTNTYNNRQVTVRVNDRGPFVATRIIDVSQAAAESLDFIRTGTVPVVVEVLGTTAAAGAQTGPIPSSGPLTTTIPGQSPGIQGTPLVQSVASAPPVQAPQPVQAPPPIQAPPPVQAPQPIQQVPPVASPVQGAPQVPPSAQQIPPLESPAPQSALPVQPGPAPQPIQQVQSVVPPVQAPQSVPPQSAPPVPGPAPVSAPQSVPPPQSAPPISSPAPIAQAPQEASPNAFVSPLPAPGSPVQTEVRPGLPPPGTNKKYRIQVGSFSVASNAVYLFERLQDAGFTPNYEAYNNAMYRVVLAAITADDVAPVVERLGAFGIREVLIREER